MDTTNTQEPLKGSIREAKAVDIISANEHARLRRRNTRGSESGKSSGQGGGKRLSRDRNSLGRKRNGWKSKPTGQAWKVPYGEIVCSDALLLLSELKEECADIVFLDPPFNLGKRYGSNGPGDDRKDDVDYFLYMYRVLNRAAEVLKPGGALFLYHIPRWASRFSVVLSDRLLFRHWIAIAMKGSFPIPRHLYPAHYALLYFTKGDPAYFRRPKIRPATCPHCKRLLKDYGGYSRFVKDGVNLSDVWEDISPVRHEKHKHRPANELPPEIAHRVIEMSG